MILYSKMYLNTYWKFVETILDLTIDPIRLFKNTSEEDQVRTYIKHSKFGSEN